MKERERILELVKKGVLSSEEALVLLENLAVDKDDQQIKKEVGQTNYADTEPSKTFDEQIQAKAVEDKEQLEKILDELATKANQASAELDELNLNIHTAKEKIAETEEKVMVLNAKEELDDLSDVERDQRTELEETVKRLNTDLDNQKTAKEKLQEKIKQIKKEQKAEKEETFTSNFEIPSDWKEQASESFNQLGEKMTETGIQFGSLIKKTLNNFSDSFNDNFDFEDLRSKVAGLTPTKFTHIFNYPLTKASLIDIKVVSGNIILKTWDSDDVKIEADIKLYGRMDATSPLEAFLERSQIHVDDEIISFQVPNKRIRTDLVVYLPKRVYDHVVVKVLNGNILVEDMQTKDTFMKSTNGTIIFEKINATMLEIKGVNGDIKVLNGEILDSIIDTINGTITVTTVPETISARTIDGSIKLTFNEANIKKIRTKSVNGSVKIALPKELGADVTVKAGLGSINNRLSDFEVIRENKSQTNQFLEILRNKETEIAQVAVETMTGSIFMKDTDQS